MLESLILYQVQVQSARRGLNGLIMVPWRLEGRIGMPFREVETIWSVVWVRSKKKVSVGCKAPVQKMEVIRVGVCVEYWGSLQFIGNIPSKEWGHYKQLVQGRYTKMLYCCSVTGVLLNKSCFSLEALWRPLHNSLDAQAISLSHAPPLLHSNS